MSDWVTLCVIGLLLILLTGSLYFVYSGLLTEIFVLTGVPPIKRITLAYKFQQGPYKYCGQLFKETLSIGPKLPSIGIYYDDPKEVPGPRCRYAVGSILSEGENQADEELLKSFQSSGFNVFTIPEVTHVVRTVFPHRTFLSVLLGLSRVYPRLELYIKERRLCAHPFLEIYREGRIHYMAPLARQDDFYVPEIRQVEKRLSDEEELHSDSDVSGADSNSECSSGSGVLLSDSRDSSLSASSLRSVPLKDQEESDGMARSSGSRSLRERSLRSRSSKGGSLRGLDIEEASGPQGEAEELLHGDSGHKSLEAPAQWWGAVGGEE